MTIIGAFSFESTTGAGESSAGANLRSQTTRPPLGGSRFMVCSSWLSAHIELVLNVSEMGSPLASIDQLIN